MASKRTMINRVGMGVDVQGGEESLALLRQIRTEMQAIASLSRTVSRASIGRGASQSAAYADPRQQTLFWQQESRKQGRLFDDIEQTKTRIVERETRKRGQIVSRAQKEEEARQRKLAKVSSPISNAEVDLAIREQQRKAALKESINAKILKNEQMHQAQMIKAARDARLQEERMLRRTTPTGARGTFSAYASQDQYIRGADQRAKALRDEKLYDAQMMAHRKRRSAEVVALANKEAIQLDDVQRRIFRRHRNDPAARIDPVSQRMRDDYAVTMRAARVQRDRASAQRQQDMALEEARLARVSAIREKQFSDWTQRNRRIEKRDRTLRNEAAFIDVGEGTTARFLNRTTRETTSLQRGLGTLHPSLRGDADALINKFNQLAGKAQGFQSELANVNRGRHMNAVLQDMQGLNREFATLENRAANLRSRQAQLIGANVPPRAGGGGRGGGRGPIGPNLGPPDDLINPGGFFTSADAVGRITRNILLYQAVSTITYGLVGYVQNALTAAKATVEFGNALRFATETAGGNLAQNERLAESLLGIGLSRQQGRAAVIEAARFTEERPWDTEALTRTVADIAAQRGQGIDRTDELIEQLRRRESKFYKRIFGRTVESIYEDEARKYLSTQSVSSAERSLFVGADTKIDFRTQREEIARYVAAMTDADKENAVLNYTLSQSSRFQGEAIERATTLAGRMDKLSAAWLNGTENVGLFITELKIMSDVIDGLTNSFGLLGDMTPPILQRTGSGGTISNADIQRFAAESATGGRARALQTANSILTVPNLLSATGLGVGALLGRNPARNTVRLDAYNKAYKQAIVKFNGDFSAATTEAVQIAKGQRAGFVRSVGAGMQRVTHGITQAVTDFTGAIIGGPTQQRLDRSFIARATGRAVPAGPPGPDGFPTASIGRGQIVGSVAGGVAGGVAGALIGNLVADSISAGPITAAGLTILGGVVGTAGGTFLGSAVGGAIGAKTAGVAGGLLGGVSLATIAAITAPLAIAAYIGTSEYGQFASDIVKREEAAARASARQTKELRQAEGDDRVRFNALVDGNLRSMTPDEFRAWGGGQSRRLSTPRPERVGTFGQIGGLIGRYLGSFQDVPIEEIVPTNYSREVLTARDPRLQVRSLQQIESRLQALARSQNYFDPLSRTTTGDTGALQTRFDASQFSRETGFKVQAAERALQVAETDRSFVDPTDTAEIAKAEQNIRTLRDQLNELREAHQKIAEAQNQHDIFKQYGTLDDKRIAEIEKYRQAQEKAWEARKKADEKAFEEEKKLRQERINQQANALNKLRDASQGSFRLVGDIATSVVGEANQFVKPLAEQATILERMTQQWGFLGDAAVQYFTAIEEKAINRQLNALEFGTRRRVGDLREQSSREQAARNAPGLSRADQDYLNIQSAIVDRATQIPQLWLKAAQVLGQTVTPLQSLNYQMSELGKAFGIQTGPTTNLLGQSMTVPKGTPQRNLLGQIISNPRTGIAALTGQTNLLEQTIGPSLTPQAMAWVNASPEVRSRVEEQFADSALSILNQYDPKTIRQAGLTGLYTSAVGIKDQALGRNIQAMQAKAVIGLEADAELDAQLRADDAFRLGQIASGRDPLDVGREADSLLLARTEGVDAKDLTVTQFADRQAALRREAQRTVEDEQKAKDAVTKGLEYQERMASNLDAIRQAIIDGDISMLVQVQNDTQARIDQTALQEANGAGYNIPLDQGQVKSNPYTNALTRYGRGGRKR